MEFINNAFAIIFWLPVLYFTYDGIRNKNYAFPVGFLLLLATVLTITFIKIKPLETSSVITGFWLIICSLYTYFDKEKMSRKQKISFTLIQTLKFSFATVIIAIFIGLAFSGGSGTGNCTRATPQYC